MRVLYVDTSALVKHYVDEKGSKWINRLLRSAEGHLIFTSHLTVVEATCAFARRAREGTLPTQALRNVVRLLEYDVTYRYHILTLIPATVDKAQALAIDQPLRAYDAVQLASAHLANQTLTRAEKPPLIFLSADSRLVEIARVTGLIADNPNDHA
jgi:hypothetical protein